MEILFQYFKAWPPFDSKAKRIELLEMLNRIEGILIDVNKIDRRPSFKIQELVRTSTMNQFLEVLDWIVETFKSEGG